MNITVIGRKEHRIFTIVTLAFLVALFVIAAAAASGNGDGDTVATLLPVTSAETEKKIYAVICDGLPSKGESEKALGIFEGFGVKAVFFINADELEDDVKAVSDIIARGHSLGINCKGTSDMSKNEFLRWLARQNERFYEQTGRRPRYCLAQKDACRYAFEACLSYGQYCVAAACGITSGEEEIKKGDIVMCLVGSDGTLYAFVQAASAAAANGLKPAPLKELMREYEENAIS